ncbi:MAG: leucine-rich repeat protein [Tannerella sp.]|nr:leucine-rich repeat protein [Tannerella sp.]
MPDYESYNSVPWYSLRESISTAVIESGVTGISSGTFSGCGNLTSVTIPSSVTNIGKFAFSGCYSLTSIELPNSLESIGTYAFNYCRNLTSIEIPASVTSIESAAFVFCSSLSAISVNPANAYYLSEEGILYNKTKTELHTFPGGKSGTFSIPGSVTDIGDQAFSYCAGLTSVEIPNSVTSIGESAFSLCTGLTSVAIPNSVISIGSVAFGTCTGLTSVEIPNSVINIGESAFSLCTGLTSVVIPGSVTSIERYAFFGCSSLRDLTIERPAPLLLEVDEYEGVVTVFLNVPLSAATLHVPAGTKAAYEAADIWKDFGTIVEAAAGLDEKLSLHGDSDVDGPAVTSLGFGADERLARDCFIASNVEWTAVGSEAWLTVAPASGTGDAAVRITAAANTGEARTATLTLRGGGITRTVAVVQEAKAAEPPPAPPVVVEPSQPEGDRGTIDISLSVPVSETFTVTFTVSLPAGFVLDTRSTTLVDGLLSSFELEITPGVNNWLFAIRPKLSLRAADETMFREVVRIAYTMDETVGKGAHEVTLNDVDLTLSSGRVIHQDEIRASVVVVTPSGIASVDATDIRYADNMLTVNTPAAEQITVYSPDGAAVYQAQKQPGVATFDLSRLPRGLLIVRGDSGWTRKIVR